MANSNQRELILQIVEELFVNDNLDSIEGAFAANYMAHASGREYTGHPFLKQFMRQLRKSIPDVKVVDLEFIVEDGNRITWQRTLSGTHKANMQGIPASNKKVTWNELVVSEFSNDQISKEWVVSELMGQLLLKQSAKAAKAIKA